MKTTGEDGEVAHAKKRTTVMTNSVHLGRLLRQAQCDGSHVHQHLLDGRAGPCERYPDKFCRLVCQAIKREIRDAKWRKKMCKEFDITEAIGRIMAITRKVEELEPPEEKAWFDALYADADFYDDITGSKLDKEAATEARITEMTFFKELGVYSRVLKQPWVKIIATKWLDINKGDAENPNLRARLVGCELKACEQRDDLFAATPPLESLKAVLSLCASRQARRNPHRIMSIDVKRAYFYAPATRAIYIRIPKEDWEDGDEFKVGKLNLSLYGTRDAAPNWSRTYTEFLTEIGFDVGACSPCNFYNKVRDMALTVHGDDFTVTGS